MAKITQLAVTHLNVGKHQVFERLWLMATALGISLQPMSQILEIPDLKSEVSKLIPVQEVYPMQTFRMGYAKQEKEHTPRRNLEEEQKAKFQPRPVIGRLLHFFQCQPKFNLRFIQSAHA